MIFAMLTAKKVCRPKVLSHDKTIEYAKKDNLYDMFLSYDVEDFSFFSFDNYNLKGKIIKQKEKTNKFIIVTHGYTANMYSSIKYVNLFFSLGYNVVIYDNRGHGDNKAYQTTFGVCESKDLSCLFKYLMAKYQNDIEISLHGESLGSAVSILSMNYGVTPKFIIADCGYDNLANIFMDATKSRPIQRRLLPLVYFAMKKMYGVYPPNISPIEVLKHNNVPILFIHGQDDRYILPKHSASMYEANLGYKELHIIPLAHHARSINTNKEMYYNIVSNFLNKVDK